MIAIDSETALIDRGELYTPPPACITYCRDDTWEPGILHWTEAEDFLASVFEKEQIVGANMAFDATVLIKAYPRLKRVIYQAYDEGRVLCVQNAQRLIDLGQGCLNGYRTAGGVWIEHQYSLAALYERYGLGQLAKGEDTYRLRYGELIPVPLKDWPREAVDYAKLDAFATLKVWANQQNFSEFLVDLAAQCRKHLELRHMSHNGIYTDMKMCLEYLEETKQHIEDSKTLLVKHGLVRNDAKGTRDTKVAKARMEIVCAELGIEPKRTAKDGISLDAEATRDTGDEVLQAYSTYTSATTILKKVVELQEGAKGLPLQTEYDPIKANGRSSSRKPRKGSPIIGVQMHNLPRGGKMRRCFVAPPGCAIVSIDFNMHELVTVSQCQIWLTGSSKLADALNAGRDVHCEVASMLLGCSYEEVLANKKHGKYQLARNQSKEVNFGGWGVMTPRRLMLQMNKKRRPGDPIVTLEQATEIMRAWEARWEPQTYFDAVARMFPEHNPWSVTTIRQFISGRIRALVGFPDACNGLFSGLAADASGAASYELGKACKLAEPGEPLYDCRQISTIHDETLLYAPLKTLHESAFAATKIFVDTAQQFTPDVRLTAAPAAMLNYDKDADTVLKNGELQLWFPEKKAA